MLRRPRTLEYQTQDLLDLVFAREDAFPGRCKDHAGALAESRHSGTLIDGFWIARYCMLARQHIAFH